MRALAIARQRTQASVVLRPSVFWPLLHELTRGFPTLLDVGCGTMVTLSQLRVPVRVGIDAHRPYLEKRIADESVIPVHLDAAELERHFLPKSFALVTMVDFIEHLTKPDALSTLDAIERLAQRRTLVFTPRGDFPQENFDAYGLGGEHYQTHRSTWEPEEFAVRGYSTAVFAGMHHSGNASFEQAFNEDAKPVDAILAWKNFE
jgi:hypothetical protein